MENFFKCTLDFKFPTDEIDQAVLKEKDGNSDEEEEKGTPKFVPDPRFIDFDELDHFNYRPKPIKKAIKKSKNIPDVFKSIKIPIDDSDIYFCDLTEFPNIVYSEEEALKLYNNKGLFYNVQFKILSRRQSDKGEILSFTLGCVHANDGTTDQNKPKFIQNIEKCSEEKENSNPNCKVRAVFKWKSSCNYYERASKMYMHHCHPLEEDKIKYGRNGREEIMSWIEIYLQADMEWVLIQNVINKKFNTDFKYSEIYYMIQKIRNQQKLLPENKSESLELLARLKKMCEESPEARFVHEMTSDGKKIKNILIQTPQMHRLYERYSDVIFMDGTYMTNKYKMPLVIFSSINNEGKNVIVGFAIVERETKETYQWLLQSMKVMNEGKEPGVILTDFDAAMCHGIEKVFEKSEHLLCQWHMMQNFKRHFKFLKSKRSAEANQLHKMVIGLIFTESFEEFEQFLHYIFSSSLIDETKKQYLRKLVQIKQKWAAHACAWVFNGGTHTTSRIESVNARIKDKLWSKSTLSDCLDRMLEIEQQVKDNILCKEKKLNEREHVIHHPLIKHIYDQYSNFAFEKMLFEYSLCHEYFVKKLSEEKGDKQVTKYVVKDKSLRQNNIVTVLKAPMNKTKFLCNCRFNCSNNMYCSHIFSVMNLEQVKSLEGIVPLHRWTKKQEWQNYKHIDRIMDGEKPHKECLDEHGHHNHDHPDNNGQA
ncbi:unnamed protein product [Moneuplotes crassus]|uniref:MULE transposase domain-containing protein n=1 Tax=Euplotes crassus TaxID=5936 RepID=A0AAD1Y968_EUPCR|nr:unnamed protein product [Moneuplotes crassus]